MQHRDLDASSRKRGTFCTFLLLINNSRPNEVCNTADSIVRFADHARQSNIDIREVLCVASSNSIARAVRDKADSPLIRSSGPEDWLDNWRQDFESGIIPPISGLLGIGSNLSRGMIYVLLGIGSTIRREAFSGLVDAIWLVDSDSKCLVLSHDLRSNRLPNSAVLASSMLDTGLGGGFSSSWGIKCKRRLLGRCLRFERSGHDFEPTFPWLVASIAYSYQWDRDNRGLRIHYADWT